MVLQAGKLRHLVTIQSPVSTKDDSGGPVISSWVNLSPETTYASIEPIGGRELWALQMANSLTTHRITIRYQQGITARCRVKYGDRYFQISAVLNVEERNRELQLLCTEIV